MKTNTSRILASGFQIPHSALRVSEEERGPKRTKHLEPGHGEGLKAPRVGVNCVAVRLAGGGKVSTHTEDHLPLSPQPVTAYYGSDPWSPKRVGRDEPSLALRVIEGPE